MAEDKIVYVLNSGQDGAISIGAGASQLPNTYANKDNAFPTKAFATTSVNPAIKVSGITEENILCGVSVTTPTVQFFEVRSKPTYLGIGLSERRPLHQGVNFNTKCGSLSQNTANGTYNTSRVITGLGEITLSSVSVTIASNAVSNIVIADNDGFKAGDTIVFTTTNATPNVSFTLTVDNNMLINNFAADERYKANMMNRIGPTGTSSTTYLQNLESTSGYRIKCYDSSTTEGQLVNEIDLTKHDYFVMVYPDLTTETTAGIIRLRPHFAKITEIHTYDVYGDAFDFTPKLSGDILKGSNFEIYKGPRTDDTDIVAISYGLRGIDNSSASSLENLILDKHDVYSKISRPTVYFYNERLENKNKLNYGTKYILTSGRYMAPFIDTNLNHGSSNSAYGISSSILTLSTTGVSYDALLRAGHSLFRKDSNNRYHYSGNIKSVDTSISNSPKIVFEYTIGSAGNSGDYYIGSSYSFACFKTKSEQNNFISDSGPYIMDANIIDNAKIQDELSTPEELLSRRNGTEHEYNFNSVFWKDTFRNINRNLLDRTSVGPTTTLTLTGVDDGGTQVYDTWGSNQYSSHFSANLIGKLTYAHYKKSPEKSNVLRNVREIALRKTKSNKSGMLSIYVSDQEGIQHKKLKESMTIRLRNQISTANLLFKTGWGKITFDVSNTKFTISELTSSEDLNNVLVTGNTIRIGDYYYIINTISALNASAGTQDMTMSAYRHKASPTFTTATSPILTISDVNYEIYPYTNNKLYTNINIPTTYDYTYNKVLDSSKYIRNQDNKLYTMQLLFRSGDLSEQRLNLNYGDSTFGYIVPQLSTFDLYEPSMDSLEYYSGFIGIENKMFSGVIETQSYETDKGIRSLKLDCRDIFTDMIGLDLNKNLEFSEDYVYTSLSPYWDFTSQSTVSVSSYNSGTRTVNLNMAGIGSGKAIRYLFKNDKTFLGEIKCQDSNNPSAWILEQVPTETPSGNVYVLEHKQNYMILGKAAATEDAEETRTTSLKGSSNKGLVFTSGKNLNENGSDDDELITASSYPKINDLFTEGVRAKGFSVNQPRGMRNNEDSYFATKLSYENRHNTTHSSILTPSATPKLPIIKVNNKDDSPVSIEVAMISPIYMGRVDNNAQDTAYANSKGLYLLNTGGLAEGGVLHRLHSLHTLEPQVELGEVFRYAGLQKFVQGQLYRSPYILFDGTALNFSKGEDNAYNHASGIHGYARLYQSKADFTSVTPYTTLDATPLLGSNYLDGKKNTDGTDFWYPKTFCDGDAGNTGDGSQVRDSPVKELREVWELHDPSYQNYELFASGGLFPDSYLRAENMFGDRKQSLATDKALSSYSLILSKEGNKARSSLEHTNYVGESSNMVKEDKDYDYLNINSVGITKYPFRFSLIRLTEMTMDWHFNLVNPINIISWGQNLVKACGTGNDRQGNNSNNWRYIALSGFYEKFANGFISNTSTTAATITNGALNVSFNYTGAYVFTETGYFIGKIASVNRGANPDSITFAANAKRTVANTEAIRIHLIPQKDHDTDAATEGQLLPNYGTAMYFKFLGMGDGHSLEGSNLSNSREINFTRIMSINDDQDNSMGLDVPANSMDDSPHGRNKILFGPISDGDYTSPYWGPDRWNNVKDIGNTIGTADGAIAARFYYHPSKIVQEISAGLEPDVSTFFSVQNAARRNSTGVRGYRNIYHGMHLTLFNTANWYKTEAGVAGTNSRGLTTYIDKSSTDIKHGGYAFNSANNMLSRLTNVGKNVGGNTGTNNYTNVSLVGGSGTGATINLTVVDGVVTVATINVVGSGYNLYDTLTVPQANIGSATIDATFVIYETNLNIHAHDLKYSGIHHSAMSDDAQSVDKTFATISGSIGFGNNDTVGISASDAKEEFEYHLGTGLKGFTWNQDISSLDNRTFLAEGLFKPTIPDAINGVTIGTTTTEIVTENDDGLHWLNYVPNLAGKYLVGVEGSAVPNYLVDGNIPSKDNQGTTNIKYNRYPKVIVRIISHTFNNGTHTLTYSETINVSDVGGTWRVMMINPVTIPKGKQRINMFRWNNKYVMSDEDNLTEYPVGYKLFQQGESLQLENEGIWELYLPASIEQSKLDGGTNATSHIVMTKYIDWTNLFDRGIYYPSVFSFGSRPELYLTDGYNGERVTFESDSLYMKFQEPIDKNYYGAVSLGEIFTIKSDVSTNLSEPTHAVIAPKLTICDEVEKAIEDLLENNEIEYDMSTLNLYNSGFLVKAYDSTAKTIDLYVDEDTAKAKLEFSTLMSLYNENHEVIGLLSTITNSGGVARLTLTDWRHSPNINDILFYNKSWPYFVSGTISGDNLLSAIEYLSAYKDISVVSTSSKIDFEHDDTEKTSKADLSYNNPDTHIISTSVTKSVFNYANKVIVYGDGIKAEASRPQANKKTKTLQYYNNNIKTNADARVKAEMLLDLHSVPRNMINVKINRRGIEFIDVGDIVTLNFPQQGIPHNEYMIVEIKETFTDSLELEVVANDTSISERMAELLVSQKKTNAKIFNKNLVIDAEVVRGYDDFTVIPQQLTVRHNSVGTSGAFGFTPIFGFTLKWSFTPIISAYTEIELI